MVTKQLENISSMASQASGWYVTRPGAFTDSFVNEEQASQPAIESMLFGICLRGWISESEKDFLDGLAPHKSVTFFIYGDRYLHPEGVKLFPHDVIETAIQKGGKAVFSHRYQFNSYDAPDPYTIYTAVINQPGPEPLVLGFFGPEHQLGLHETKNKFFRLVSQFRDAHHQVKDFAQAVSRRLESNKPTIIINRSSGRVLTLNETAALFFHDDPRNLVDLEFGQLKDQFLSILPRYRLKMTNLCEDDLYLTVITTSPTDTPEKRESLGVPYQFVQQVNDKLQHMTKAAKALETLGRDVMNEQIAVLARHLGEAADELNLSIAKLIFLSTNKRNDLQLVSNGDEFENEKSN